MQINNREDALEFLELVKRYIEYLHATETHLSTNRKQSAADLRRAAAEEAGLSVDQIADFDSLDFRADGSNFSRMDRRVRMRGDSGKGSVLIACRSIVTRAPRSVSVSSRFIAPAA